MEKYTFVSWTTARRAERTVEESVPVQPERKERSADVADSVWDQGAAERRAFGLLLKLGNRDQNTAADVAQDAFLLWWRARATGTPISIRRAVYCAFFALLRREGSVGYQAIYEDGSRTRLYRRKRDAWRQHRGANRVVAIYRSKPVSPALPARAREVFLDLPSNAPRKAVLAARLMARGFRQGQIAQRLQVSQPRVSQLLASLRDLLGEDYCTTHTLSHPQRRAAEPVSWRGVDPYTLTDRDRATLAHNGYQWDGSGI